EAHPRAVLRRLLENDRAADVCVVAIDREALEADLVDTVALIARGVAGHHAHRAGSALPGDEAEGVRAHTLAGGKTGHAGRGTDDVPEVGIHALAWRRDGHGFVDIGWELGHSRRIPSPVGVVQRGYPTSAATSAAPSERRRRGRR